MKFQFANTSIFIITTTFLFYTSSSAAIPSPPSNPSLGLNSVQLANSSSISNNTVAPNHTPTSNNTVAPNPTPASNNTVAPNPTPAPVPDPYTTVKCPLPNLITPDYGYGLKVTPNKTIPPDSPGSTFSFFCYRDFHLEPNDPYRVCQENGTWNGVQHECAPDSSARCPDPVLPEHSLPRNPMLEFPIFSILHMGCEEGWVGRGNFTVQCDYNKKWLIDFQCEQECDFNGLPEHSLFSPDHKYSNIAVNETVPVMCEPGYHLLGVPDIPCNSSGHTKVQFGCCPDKQTYEAMRSVYNRNPEYFYGPILMLMAILNLILVIKLVHQKKKENKILSTDMIKVKPAKCGKDLRLDVQMRTVRNPIAHEYSPYRKFSREDTF